MVRPIPCGKWRQIPDTIGRSCTNTDTENDVTQLGHIYHTYNSSSPSHSDDDVDIEATCGDVVMPCLL